MTVDELQDRFRKAGRHVPSEKHATNIVAAIPLGCTATGWNEEELIEMLIDAPSTATNRLVAMYKAALRRGVYS